MLCWGKTSQKIIQRQQSTINLLYVFNVVLHLHAQGIVLVPQSLKLPAAYSHKSSIYILFDQLPNQNFVSKRV